MAIRFLSDLAGTLLSYFKIGKTKISNATSNAIELTLPSTSGTLAKVGDTVAATNVSVATTAFNRNLSASDDTVQKALNTIDDFTKITVSATEPSTPTVNDLWVDIS